MDALAREPKEDYYEDYDHAVYWDLKGGPLLSFLPRTSRNIYSVAGPLMDTVIAEYTFEKSDLEFFHKNWTAVTDDEEFQWLQSSIKGCPWNEFPSDQVKYFKWTQKQEDSWPMTGYAMVDETRLKAWYFYSVLLSDPLSICL
ncbi:MAG: hypothetical protein H6858_09655 [Rhodospirillales bacterium]|nr:hypothetical protein [Alphaproteobacteria bacterium]MCB1841021.1 hypothetical protein [Alphaproteobacteria bacterium]MCB9977850.1 hypothetical protein [Rhodospirillales bacterium]